MNSETHYFAKGTIIADSHEQATGLMVITSGHVDVELPIDSAEAAEENSKRDGGGKTLLFVLGRGCVFCKPRARLTDAIYQANQTAGDLMDCLAETLWAGVQW